MGRGLALHGRRSGRGTAEGGWGESGDAVRLTIATPLAIVIEAGDVAHLRAEDETGAFGILPGHADFLTALAVSVASWRDNFGAEHYVAVRGGMLEMRDGDAIAIATPEAVPGDDLHRVEQHRKGDRALPRRHRRCRHTAHEASAASSRFAIGKVTRNTVPPENAGFVVNRP